LAKLSPESQKIIRALEEEVVNLECISYSAAYRDGMADLMAAMTLNKLGVTKVEHYDLRESSPARFQGQIGKEVEEA